MKVFISWSGDRGSKIGEVFTKYTRYIIPDAEIFFSQDAERGIRWFDEIAKELDETDIGIVCLTRDNLDSHWMLFESGALAKKMEHTRLLTFLFDLKPSDVDGPLAFFNHSKNNKGGIRKLYETLNNQCEDSWDVHDFERIFNQWWPEIKKELDTIPKEEIVDEEPVREDREILEEILNNVRFERKQSVRSPRNKVINMFGYIYSIHLHDSNSLFDFGYEIIKKYHKYYPAITRIKSSHGDFIKVYVGGNGMPLEWVNEIQDSNMVKRLRITHPQHSTIEDF